MGGNHKRNLRKEKTKVKLKGSKLPAGLNVTKTDFKVKKILIKDQLRETQLENGRRILNFKEILCRLKNSSASFRLDALRNLSELIGCSEGVTLHLSELVKSIGANCLGIEKDIRRESFKVLNTLFASVPMETIQPFFHILSSYLRCAMTHIQPDIQEDSLLFLDVLLLHFPKLVSRNNTQIFENFIDMISRIRSDSEPSRMLTVNMGNKMTAIKWRSRILDRLRGILKALVEDRQTCQKGRSNQGLPQLKTAYNFNISQPQYFPIINWHLTANDTSSQIFRSSCGENATTLASGQTVRDYIEQLMPLIIESWLEVRPNADSYSKQTLLSNDAACTLEILLDILEYLWSLLNIHEIEMRSNEISKWFRSEFTHKFITHFLENFPYKQPVQNKANPKGGRTNQRTFSSDPNCVGQNITLAYLAFRFFESNHNTFIGKTTSIMKFLTRTIKELKSNDASHLKHLENALRAALVTNGSVLLKNEEIATRELLESVVSAAENNWFSKEMSTKILLLLCDIVFNPTLYKEYGYSVFEPWLSALPHQILLKTPIPKSELIALSNLGKQKNVQFLSSLPSSIEAVIEKLQTTQVQGSENALEGKKLIMNLFFWIDDLKKEHQQQLLKKIDECVKDKRMSAYFKFIITKGKFDG